MRKLAGENAALGDEMRGAQENLRLSAGTLNKLQGEFKGVCGELDETKKRLGSTEEAWKKLKSRGVMVRHRLWLMRSRGLNVLIEKKNNEIRALGGEVQDAQENIRLCLTQQAGRLTSELNDYRARFGQSTQEVDTYKGENAQVGR